MSHVPTPRTHWPRVAGIVAALVLVVAAVGCGSDDSATADPEPAGELTVTEVWARPGIAGGNTGIYLTIEGGETDDRLVGVTTDPDFAESVEIHETVTVDDAGDMTDDTGDGHDMTDDTGDGHDMTDDAAHDDQGDDVDHGDHGATPMRTMRPVEAVEVPAGATVALEPGGLHVMVMGLTDELAPGDTFAVTLHFENAGELHTTATVAEA